MIPALVFITTVPCCLLNSTPASHVMWAMPIKSIAGVSVLHLWPFPSRYTYILFLKLHLSNMMICLESCNPMNQSIMYHRWLLKIGKRGTDKIKEEKGNLGGEGGRRKSTVCLCFQRFLFPLQWSHMQVFRDWRTEDKFLQMWEDSHCIRVFHDAGLKQWPQLESVKSRVWSLRVGSSIRKLWVHLWEGRHQGKTIMGRTFNRSPRVKPNKVIRKWLGQR